MDVEFDATKDTANVQRHGVSLAFGVRVFTDADRLVVPTIRVEDGERRMKAIGMVAGKLWTAVHVMRGEAVRFISVRRSNDGEERLYHRS